MNSSTELLNITPVLPTADLSRDIEWYREMTGFDVVYQDKMYAVLKRENLYLHLQWHADSMEDPLQGGSAIKIFVKNIEPLFSEFVQRGTLSPEKFVSNTSWKTNEFGFYDLNKNAIFIVEDLE